MQIQQCAFCGTVVQLIFIHGHYQCPVCGNNVLPCCEGESENPADNSEQLMKKENKNIDSVKNTIKKTS